MSGSAILKFDRKRHPFDSKVAECVRRHLAATEISGDSPILSKLHEFARPKDLDDIYAAIYDLFLTAEFIQPYENLCGQIIKEKFAGKAAYQRVPSVRIQMPGQTSVNYHTDEWYGHGHNVQNFWLPLTAVSGTNSLYVSDEQTSLSITEQIRGEKNSIEEMNKLARRACHPLSMKFGEVYCFNSHIIHGTERNDTDQTRVSFDFRMLQDGDDRGMKDESFFVSPGQQTETVNARHRTSLIYIGKRRGFTQVISQKYQALLCNRYAAENHISASVAETELSGFDHLPALWNMVSGTYAGSFSDLIIFSAFLLPENPTARMKLANECKARQLTLHFVAEDIIARPENMLEQVEAGYRKSECFAAVATQSGKVK
jgi:sporadic carbohydrate cluster 2OG-Fe(II) oxygenase